MKIETSVARHRKFVQAGPAPSWLWLCGIAYCKEGLTDGFIPKEALDFLGVKNAKQLAGHLVRARLWEEADGGWFVHDYLDHNQDADTVKANNAQRAKNGLKGGRVKPSSINLGLPEQIEQVEQVKEQPSRGKEGRRASFDEFWAAYPKKKAKDEAQRAWMKRNPNDELLAVMLRALERQKHSPDWQKESGRYIPFPATWLNRGQWLDDDAPPDSPEPWTCPHLERCANRSMCAQASILERPLRPDVEGA